MALDDLSRPLGTTPREAAAPGFLARSWRWLFAGVAIAALAGTWTMLRRDGAPTIATAEIKRIPIVSNEFTGTVQKRGIPAEKPPEDPSAGKPVATAEELEEAAGVKVVRGGGVGAPPSIVIMAPQDNRVRLAAAPDRRLVEKSKHGQLPRVGPDGARPADIYARPASLEPAQRGRPRIAIVIGSLGVNRQATADAIARLPGEVTLAFAPYGEAIAAQVAKARENGHEVLLQAPMEPFDYPANDPGPHTLLVASAEGENADRLHWLMTRFPGFVGVTNFLGAKFTADPAALEPVLRDIGRRGLIYFDDGASARSIAVDLASRAGFTAIKADRVVDLSTAPAALDAALAELEEIARRDGTAIASATAHPATVARIARWAGTLKDRGITLVPLTAVAGARRRS